MPLDVHLMIENPDAYIPQFAKSASIITVHQEACVHLHRTLQLIRSHGVKPGVVINPGTPAEMIKPVLTEVDLVLLMTVNPGFGGQSFIKEVVPKIAQIAAWREEMGLDFEIEIDGGVNEETAPICTENGADVLVAGSAVFNQSNRKEAIDLIRKSAKK